MLDTLQPQPRSSIHEMAFGRDGQHDQIGMDLISRDEMATSLNASVAGLNGLVAGFEISSNDDVNVAEVNSIKSLRVGKHGLSPG